MHQRGWAGAGGGVALVSTAVKRGSHRRDSLGWLWQLRVMDVSLRWGPPWQRTLTHMSGGSGRLIIGGILAAAGSAMSAFTVPKEVASGSLVAPSGGQRGSLPKMIRPIDSFQRRGGVKQQCRAHEADGDGRKNIFLAWNCYRG
jgi:hypothetical protein